jgi:hypothetical protein
MKYFIFIFLLISHSGFCFAEGAGPCEIYNTTNDLLGLVTTSTGKVASFNPQSKTYQVNAIATEYGLVYVVYKRTGLVVSEMARVSPDGTVYDVRDVFAFPGIPAKKIGKIQDGLIINRYGATVGSYQGCEELNSELRTYRIGAGAARFLLFDFNVDKWNKSYQSCPVSLCTW